MKRRIMLLVVLTLIMGLVGCGETTETKQPEATKTEQPKTAVLQIQRMKNCCLKEEGDLPYEIPMYEKSTDAYNNPVTIKVADEATITMSFTSEEHELAYVGIGLIIEKDCETNQYWEWPNEVGEISTVELNIDTQEEACTVIYPLHLDYGTYWYIAFRIEPAASDPTQIP